MKTKKTRFKGTVAVWIIPPSQNAVASTTTSNIMFVHTLVSSGLKDKQAI